MSSTDFTKTIAARVRARAHFSLHSHGQRAVEDHPGAMLTRRIERARHAARTNRSRIGPQVPKT